MALSLDWLSYSTSTSGRPHGRTLTKGHVTFLSPGNIDAYSLHHPPTSLGKPGVLCIHIALPHLVLAQTTSVGYAQQALEVACCVQHFPQ